MLPKTWEHFKEPFAALDAPTHIPAEFIFLNVFMNGMGCFHLNNLLKMKNISLAM